MSHRRLLPAAVLLLLGLCLGFGWWQNTYGTIGGPISLAKMLWLFLALTCFLLLPGWLAADRGLTAIAPSGPGHPALPITTIRRFWGYFLAAWLLRALIEIPLLLTTSLWRCEHGIAHTLLMLVVLLTAGRRIGAACPASRSLIPLLATALASEALNAWLFSHAGQPERGQYFASSDPAFRWINRLTWLEVGLLVPWLACWLRRYASRSAV